MNAIVIFESGVGANGTRAPFARSRDEETE